MSSQQFEQMIDPTDTAPVIQQEPTGPVIYGYGQWGPPVLEPPKRSRWKRRPSKKELAAQAIREQEAMIAHAFSKTVFITVANDKGQAGKTVTSILIAAGFAHWSGKPVLLIDNNPTGKMRKRLEHYEPDARTVTDMAERMGSEPPTMETIARYVQWQQDGYFSALLSRLDPTEALPDGTIDLAKPTITTDDFVAIAKRVAPFYAFVVIDTGNNIADLNARGAIQVTSQLVGVTTWEGTKLDGLKDDILLTLSRVGYRDLVADAVIVETHGPRDTVDLVNKNGQAGQFLRNWPFVEIPPDKALVDGPIVWSRLSPATISATRLLCATISQKVARREADAVVQTMGAYPQQVVRPPQNVVGGRRGVPVAVAA